MLSIHIADELNAQWRDAIEHEVALNLPPLEPHRHYDVRFLQMSSDKDQASSYRCEVRIRDHGREISHVKITTRDGEFAIRQCLQRAKRDMKRRTAFGEDYAGSNSAYHREWQFH